VIDIDGALDQSEDVFARGSYNLKSKARPLPQRDLSGAAVLQRGCGMPPTAGGPRRRRPRGHRLLAGSLRPVRRGWLSRTRASWSALRGQGSASARWGGRVRSIRSLRWKTAPMPRSRRQARRPNPTRRRRRDPCHRPHAVRRRVRARAAERRPCGASPMRDSFPRTACAPRISCSGRLRVTNTWVFGVGFEPPGRDRGHPAPADRVDPAATRQRSGDG